MMLKIVQVDSSILVALGCPLQDISLQKDILHIMTFRALLEQGRRVLQSHLRRLIRPHRIEQLTRLLI